jgi:hypothetical protein
LSYLKPLINGRGFYHVESETRNLRRMDIVVVYGKEQFIIELKLWNGEGEHVLSERYKDKFGFTEREVEEMAQYFGLMDNIEDVKAWYNGYVFGRDTVIYNPWGIIKYMSMPEDGIKPYWINTSDNRIIKEVMQLDKAEGKKVVE